METSKQHKIAIIGLGYVGLPLAVAFAQKYAVVGFDINQSRVSELRTAHDSTSEVSQDELTAVLTKAPLHQGLYLSDDHQAIAGCNIFIVTVPTPIDKHKRPDLTPLQKASQTIGRCLKKGHIVIYESTVYPGVTEDECVPVLEQTSSLVFNEDFYCGYSPERINPGDKKRTVTKIVKVTSGSTPAIATVIDDLYNSVIDAGTYKASSIKIAEIAKVIENSQRDINIAFVNELAIICNKLGIDTQEVLQAAGTKWNFLPFSPGLVGGHCIGVDPYYLAQKAQEVGYHPEIILAGRRLNDSMGKYVASEIIKLMIKKECSIQNSSVLVLGITFKENCPDIRNTRVIDIISELQDYGCNITIYDPLASVAEVEKEFGLSLLKQPSGKYDAIVLAVAHQEFHTLDIHHMLGKNSVLYDVKGFLEKDMIDGRL